MGVSYQVNYNNIGWRYYTYCMILALTHRQKTSKLKGILLEKNVLRNPLPGRFRKNRFSDITKCVENNYVINKSEYLRTVIEVQRLILYYQPNYNFIGKY